MTAEKASLYKTEHIEKKKRKRYGLLANEYMEQKALEKAADANDLLHDIEDEIADLEPKLKVAKEEVEKVEEEPYRILCVHRQRAAQRIQDEVVIATRQAMGGIR